ncbi:hypothetical protein OPT61_g3356 [Boeremia exigua]|uniref:Uncharacterized protein n=1 Tax=Boeremia exigua TaxID=749465 RepID=A0ACC2IID5_9PLEO|nr:hypothetical protein OPT61_g3356 [Boeremia exigua]
MYFPIVPLVALASVSSALAQVATTPVAPTLPALPTPYVYPTTQMLPVPGWNTTMETFDTLATLYIDSATQLSAQIVTLARRNFEISSSGVTQYNVELAASLTASLAIVNNLFWRTAIEAEQKVCAIVYSINEQNVDNVKGKLLVAVSAEIQVIVSVAITIGNTISAIQSHINEFTNSEKTVFLTLIQAVITAATASTGPIVKLNSGLTATGVTTLQEVSKSLQGAVAGLQAAGTVDWTIS